jgi:type IV secretory pathway TraG/TraD family ATPase VirD4
MVQHNLYQFLALDESERIRQVSGLKANLSNFVYGETSKLFNTEKPEIDFTEALEKNHICYFQLPTLLCPYLAEATGKLVLQCFQSAISKRHHVSGKEQKFFSCFLDDFQDYIYPGFGALLNKSRSANIGVVFSHQSVGDLEKVGSDFAKVVLTNTNVKIVMRSNDPVSCEYFSKSFGTKTGIKKTERTKRTFLQDRTTGEASTREVEEFIYHPNEIKNLKLGEAIVAIPTLVGMIHKKIKLMKKDDLKVIDLPVPEKTPYRIEKYFAQDEPKKITQIKGKT